MHLPGPLAAPIRGGGGRLRVRIRVEWVNVTSSGQVPYLQESPCPEDIAAPIMLELLLKMKEYFEHSEGKCQQLLKLLFTDAEPSPASMSIVSLHLDVWREVLLSARVLVSPVHAHIL